VRDRRCEDDWSFTSPLVDGCLVGEKVLRALAPAIALIGCACGARLEVRREVYAGSAQLRYEGEALSVDDHSSLAEGPWRFWYRDGTLQARGDFVDGDLARPDDEEPDETRIPIRGRNGRWTSWSANGIELSEGSYRSGVREGVWLEWHDNGKPKSLTEFARGRANGLRVTWHSNGTKQSEGGVHFDRENGVQSGWDEHGVLRKQGRFVDGLPAGLFRTWDECGVLREAASFQDGFLQGTRCLWDAEGRLTCITEYARGRQDGVQVLFHKNGRVKESSAFLSGEQDGLVIARDEDDRQEWQLVCRAGDATRRFTSWYPSGAPCTERCTSDRGPEGLQREWYEDGGPRSCGVSVGGTMEGVWMFWTQAGEIDALRSGDYVAGVKRR
jgi:antitoxin component YwqK of YwqJK toxin-antitoxin module